MKKIVKNDKVIVITGRYKGAIGSVMQVLGDRVVVEGVNKVTRHKRSTDGSKLVEKEAPIHVSNVSLVDQKTDKPIKVKFVFDKENRKIRVNKKTGEEIPRHI